MKEIIFGTVVAIVGGVMALTSPIRAVAEEQKEALVIIEKSEIIWSDFHSVAGKCKMKFPAIPEHVSEKMTVPEEDYEMSYDAYISASERESMFMLLIAQYPEFVDESYAQMSLETFLNGILTHNPSNQLIFADLSLVQGHEALDFFIRTGSVYFKGRAIMVKNSLYLMAMECEMQNYDEDHFTTFVESFELVALQDGKPEEKGMMSEEKDMMHKEKDMMPEEKDMMHKEKGMMPEEKNMMHKEKEAKAKE